MLARTSWLGDRGSGSCGAESRKVRTSQSRVIANGNPRRLAGKCHRKQTATLAVVRVKRCGKSAPAFRVTGVARQTPPEARSRRPHYGAVAQVFEGCSPEPAGRPLEAPGDGVSRWMVAAALPGNAEQNPAYRPARPPCAVTCSFSSWREREDGPGAAGPCQRRRNPGHLQPSVARFRRPDAGGD